MRTLILNPGPEQRALNVVPEGREQLAKIRVEQAKAKFPGVPLAWLNHQTKKMQKVEVT